MNLMTVLFAAAAMDLATYMTDFAHGTSSLHIHSQEAEPPYRVGLAYTSACGPACHPGLLEAETFYLQGKNVATKGTSVRSCPSCRKGRCHSDLIPDGLSTSKDQITSHRMLAPVHATDWDGSVNSGWLLEH